MNCHPHLYAENILAGAVEVEGGFIRSPVVGDSGEESILPVVEVLDKVPDILPVLYKVLRRCRH